MEEGLHIYVTDSLEVVFEQLEPHQKFQNHQNSDDDAFLGLDLEILTQKYEMGDPPRTREHQSQNNDLYFVFAHLIFCTEFLDEYLHHHHPVVQSYLLPQVLTEGALRYNLSSTQLAYNLATH